MWSTFVVPNNFIWDETRQKYTVTFPASTFEDYFTSDYDTYVVKAVRMDGEIYKPILCAWEVTETGDLTLLFDETFILRITVSLSY